MKNTVVPPMPPWKEVAAKKDAGAYLSFYYSEDLSRLPVRWITKPGDNKSDPNIETMTYGLFSTCSKAMRAGAVSRGVRYVFFGTRRGNERVLTGYYRLAWYAPTPQDATDMCLAADRAHFVEKPIPFSEVDKHCDTHIRKPFRGMRLLSDGQSQCMAGLLDDQPDATAEYLEEIDRMERFNLHYGGYRYVGWKRKDAFSWHASDDYLAPKKKHSSVAVKNASTSDQWKCLECSAVTRNKALLKRCPECGAIGALRAN